MKTFLVLLKDKNRAKFTEILLHEHIQYLAELTKAGKLLLCGPFTDDSGAMLVLQANSQMDVERLIQADPFIRDAYYPNYSVTEFYEANEANNYLMAHGQTINKL